ncbi:uncharacterized protein LOC143292235 [Babylonia areolata]|uniref:uncharacterized protein LOC143292235 n=1 Tax=Babylonia areolata TaxID=304850 RepID=UPI003FD55BEC
MRETTVHPQQPVPAAAQPQQHQPVPAAAQPQQQQPVMVPMQLTAAPQPYPVVTPAAYSRTTVRRIRFRHRHFRAGFGSLVVAMILFTVGFSAPRWAIAMNDFGLWESCIGRGSCHDNVGGGPAWLDAVRSMEVLALVCFILSVAVELYQDVFKSPPPEDNKAVEILGVAAGVFGLIGVAIFGAKMNGRKMIVYDYYGGISYVTVRLRWAFGLAAAGSILGLLGAVLMGVHRVQHAGQTQQALDNLGVTTGTAPPSIPMQPIMTSATLAPPPAASYPYPTPAYPYPYPVPVASPVAPGSAPLATTPGVPASQVPVSFVLVQGQMVPVYRELPPTVTGSTAGTGQTPGPETSVDGQPSDH